MIIDALFLDFHGCLTDGRVTVSVSGDTFEHVHARDTRAIREFLARGVYVAIVTASDSPVVTAYANKVKVELLRMRDKSLVVPLMKTFGTVASLGDDVWDVPILQESKYSFCPCDGELTHLKTQVKSLFRLNTKGGYGCVSEILHYFNSIAPQASPANVKT